MEGDPFGFGSMFDNYTFIIPEYQRDFEWEGDKVFDFFKDVKEELDNGKQYFFGPIVIVSNGQNREQELIDGQQRLTSASILAAVSSDILLEASINESNPGTKSLLESASKAIIRTVAVEGTTGIWTTKITPHEDSKIFYKDLLQPGKPKEKMVRLRPNARISSEIAMLRAYKIFHEKFLETYPGQDSGFDAAKINDFMTNFWKGENYVLLQIRVPTNDAAWQIFINLNTKGQELQIMNLVKAVLLSAIDKDDPVTGATPRADYTVIWNRMVDSLDGIDFGQFLHHYFVAHKKSIQEKELYVDIVTYYFQQSKAKELIEDLERNAENYRACVKPNNSDFPFTGEESIISDLQKFAKPLGIKHAYPILLSGLTKYYQVATEKPKFAKLVEMTLKFFVRSRTICTVEPAKLERIASEAAKMIREGKPFDDIKNHFIYNQPAEPTFDAKFKEHNKVNIKRDYFILEKINQYGYMDSAADLSSVATSKQSIEHIMPKTLTQQWKNHLKRKNPSLTEPRLKQLWETNLNKWGNLSPMHKDNNTALQNLLFHQKDAHARGYKASNATINKKIERDDTDPSNVIEHAQSDSAYPEKWWDFESIDKRTETLAKKAEKVFKVT